MFRTSKIIQKFKRGFKSRVFYYIILKIRSSMSAKYCPVYFGFWLYFAIPVCYYDSKEQGEEK